MPKSRYRMVAAVSSALVIAALTGAGGSQAADLPQRDALALHVFAGWSQPSPAQRVARSRISTDALAALARLTENRSVPSSADQKVLAPYRDLARLMSGTTTLTVATGPTSLMRRPGSRTASSTEPSLVAASAACGWVEATENRYAGWPDYSWEYSWHNHLDTCWNGSRVTRLNSAYVYVNHIQFGWKYRGEVSSSVGSVGGWQLQDFKQSHMEFCLIKYGCASDLYPSAQIVQYGNGSNAISRRSTG